MKDYLRMNSFAIKILKSIIHIYKGRDFVGNWSTYLQIKKESFINIMAKYLANNPDIVIDLGSGWGRMMLLLNQSFPLQHYLCGELTSSGRNVLNSIIQKYALVNINTFAFDFYNYQSIVNIIKKKGYKRIVIFTNFAIEQIPKIDKRLFLDLLNIELDELNVIHIEPVLFQINKEKSFNHRYNQNLYEVLSNLEEHNKIKINNIEPLYYGHCHNKTARNSLLLEWSAII